MTLQSKCTEHETELQKLEARRADEGREAQFAYESATDRADSLREQILENEEDIKRLREERNHYREQCKKTEAEAQRLRENLAAAERGPVLDGDVASKLQEKDEQLKDLRDTVAKLLKSRDDAFKAVWKSKEEIKEADLVKASMKEEIRTLTLAMASLNDSLSASQSECNRAATENVELGKAVAAKERTISEQNQTVEKLKAARDDWQKVCREGEARLTTERAAWAEERIKAERQMEELLQVNFCHHCEVSNNTPGTYMRCL